MDYVFFSHIWAWIGEVMDFDEWWERWRDERIDLFVNISDASLKQQAQVMIINKGEAEDAWNSARKGMVPVERLENLLGVIEQVIKSSLETEEPYGILIVSKAAWEILLNGFNYESKLIKEHSNEKT
jgi:hypothetical protein